MTLHEATSVFLIIGAMFLVGCEPAAERASDTEDTIILVARSLGWRPGKIDAYEYMQMKHAPPWRFIVCSGESCPNLFGCIKSSKTHNVWNICPPRPDIEEAYHKDMFIPKDILEIWP